MVAPDVGKEACHLLILKPKSSIVRMRDRPYQYMLPREKKFYLENDMM